MDKSGPHLLIFDSFFSVLFPVIKKKKIESAFINICERMDHSTKLKESKHSTLIEC